MYKEWCSIEGGGRNISKNGVEIYETKFVKTKQRRKESWWVLRLGTNISKQTQLDQYGEQTAQKFLKVLRSFISLMCKQPVN